MLVGGKVWESLTEFLHRRLEKNNSQEVRHCKVDNSARCILLGFNTMVGFPAVSTGPRHLGQSSIKDELRRFVGLPFFQLLRQPIHQRPSAFHFTESTTRFQRLSAKRKATLGGECSV